MSPLLASLVIFGLLLVQVLVVTSVVAPGWLTRQVARLVSRLVPARPPARPRISLRR